MFQKITEVVHNRVKLSVVKSNHRKMLLHWLYEVVHDFDYTISTYILCVHVFDRYTNFAGHDLTRYQLIGITCLYISAKTEEIHPHPISLYSYVTEHSASIQDIINMEREILNTLNFNFYTKLPQNFLEKNWIQSLLSKNKKILSNISNLPKEAMQTHQKSTHNPTTNSSKESKNIENLFLKTVAYQFEKEEINRDMLEICNNSKNILLRVLKGEIEEELRFYIESK